MAEFEFEVGEKVLCFHGPHLYDAKVENAEVREGKDGQEQPMYLTHYSGWNRSWDEWLPASRLKKRNDENLKKQAELLKLNTSKSKQARAEKKGERSTKRKREASVETEDHFLDQMEVKIVIPDDLKHKLVDDWDMINRQEKLVTLPRSPTVDEILDGFLQFMKGKKNTEESLMTEVVAGLKVYFQNAIGSILLYQFERPQFKELVDEDPERNWCGVFGAEHFLRLFVKLPMLLTHTNVDEKGMQQLIKCIGALLKYIQKNVGKFFLVEYEEATAAYKSAAGSS